MGSASEGAVPTDATVTAYEVSDTGFTSRLPPQSIDLEKFAEDADRCAQVHGLEVENLPDKEPGKEEAGRAFEGAEETNAECVATKECAANKARGREAEAALLDADRLFEERVAMRKAERVAIEHALHSEVTCVVVGDSAADDGDRKTETASLEVETFAPENVARGGDESVAIQERSFDMEVSADDAADFDPQNNDAAREEVEGQVATEKVAGVQPRPHE